MYALVGVGEYVDPAQAPRRGALRCGRILSAPTGGVQNGFWEVSREISWRESVAVVVGAACPPRAYNNNLLGLSLGLSLGLGL